MIEVPQTATFFLNHKPSAKGRTWEVGKGFLRVFGNIQKKAARIAELSGNEKVFFSERLKKEEDPDIQRNTLNEFEEDPDMLYVNVVRRIQRFKKNLRKGK